MGEYKNLWNQNRVFWDQWNQLHRKTYYCVWVNLNQVGTLACEVGRKKKRQGIIIPVYMVHVHTSTCNSISFTSFMGKKPRILPRVNCPPKKNFRKRSIISWSEIIYSILSKSHLNQRTLPVYLTCYEAEWDRRRTELPETEVCRDVDPVGCKWYKMIKQRLCRNVKDIFW